MTSLEQALKAAARQLAGARARRRITLLLSDCRVTDDVDPTGAARALDELIVLAPAADDEEARRFASSVGARCASVGSIRSLPAQLDELLST